MLTHTVRFVKMGKDIVEKDERTKNEKHTRTLARINVSQNDFVHNHFHLSTTISFLSRRLFIAFNWPLLH